MGASRASPGILCRQPACPPKTGAEILLPGLVEAHTHLDKSLWGQPWYKNEVGPKLLDKIDNERLNKRRLGIDPYRQSARQTVQSYHGLDAHPQPRRRRYRPRHVGDRGCDEDAR